MTSFTWDWLLLNFISYGILDYYQVNVCNNYTDFVLYKLGRDKGVLLREAHIIVRTSPACYRITSFDFDRCVYTSRPTAKQVCEYLIQNFIPEYVRPKNTHERMEELRARRKQRQEEAKQPYAGHTAGEIPGSDGSYWIRKNQTRGKGPPGGK